MTQKLSIWERLLGRRQKKDKETLIRDSHGNITGKTIERFDKYGEVIERINSDFDMARNAFVPRKTKTYKRREDGSYDPDTTSYYDNRGRETIRREYGRSASGMLECREEKFVFTPSGRKTGMYLEASYDGGLWTKRYKDEYLFDSFGHAIQQKQHRFNPLTGGLTCIKDKTYTRCADGTYDPKETTYYDTDGRVTRHKMYHREQTALGNTLFGDDEKFSYTDGVRHLDEKKQMFLMIPGLGQWGTMADFERLTQLHEKREKAEMTPEEAQEIIDRHNREGWVIDPSDNTLVLTGQGPSLTEVHRATLVLHPELKTDKGSESSPLDPQILRAAQKRGSRG
ncbi:MAG: hypothetical protein SPL08_04785 [Pseudomonadota bacterium]|nr:hypothetical protein [Pseudomonadota bacterium]